MSTHPGSFVTRKAFTLAAGQVLALAVTGNCYLVAEASGAFELGPNFGEKVTATEGLRFKMSGEDFFGGLVAENKGAESVSVVLYVARGDIDLLSVAGGSGGGGAGGVVQVQNAPTRMRFQFPTLAANATIDLPGDMAGVGGLGRRKSIRIDTTVTAFELYEMGNVTTPGLLLTYSGVEPEIFILETDQPLTFKDGSGGGQTPFITEIFYTA